MLLLFGVSVLHRYTNDFQSPGYQTIVNGPSTKQKNEIPSGKTATKTRLIDLDMAQIHRSTGHFTNCRDQWKRLRSFVTTEISLSFRHLHVAWSQLVALATGLAVPIKWRPLTYSFRKIHRCCSHSNPSKIASWVAARSHRLMTNTDRQPSTSEETEKMEPLHSLTQSFDDSMSIENHSIWLCVNRNNFKQCAKIISHPDPIPKKIKYGFFFVSESISSSLSSSYRRDRPIPT